MFKAGHMIVCIVDELGFHAGLSQIISCCVAHAASQCLLQVLNSDPRVATIANQDVLACLKFLNQSKRSSILGLFAATILNDIYSNKSKLVGMLLRVLSPAEFSELCQLKADEDVLSNIPSRSRTQIKESPSHLQATSPYSQKSPNSSLSPHSPYSPKSQNSSNTSHGTLFHPKPFSQLPQQHIKSEPTNDLYFHPQQHSVPSQQMYVQRFNLKQPEPAPQTGYNIPHQQQVTSNNSSPHSYPVPPNQLFQRGISVSADNMVQKTVPRVASLSIDPAQTNGNTTGQESTENPTDPMWVMNSINSYWVPKFDLSEQDPAVQNLAQEYAQPILHGSQSQYPVQVQQSQYVPANTQLVNNGGVNGTQWNGQGSIPAPDGTTANTVPVNLNALTDLGFDPKVLNNNWEVFNLF
ncbi:unnamed protein product [Ambrosiozyma monospora]|uniref:Unnamed protein product n=1 Tax=Ambrosiozyma monospora TaxID=43982 RepID=A0ACB5U594_AMBMO|nr:unnamed protein product [Ambrosiozyma monospora]